MATWNKQTKHTDTFTNKGIDYNGTYGVARYGISTYGTASQGDGVYVKQTKHSSTFTNQTKH